MADLEEQKKVGVVYLVSFSQNTHIPVVGNVIVREGGKGMALQCRNGIAKFRAVTV